VINLAIELSPFPLVLKTQVGTSSDSVCSSEGWETGGLLGGFLIVWWKWRWVVRLCPWLGCVKSLRQDTLFAEVPEGK
jgi:hypothetical protein